MIQGENSSAGECDLIYIQLYQKVKKEQERNEPFIRSPHCVVIPTLIWFNMAANHQQAAYNLNTGVQILRNFQRDCLSQLSSFFLVHFAVSMLFQLFLVVQSHRIRAALLKH